jgi:hypothetical protein
MAKAADTPTTTRRTVLGGSLAFAALVPSGALPATSVGLGPPLPLANPTDLGKRLLATLALYRDAWSHGSLTDEQANATSAFLREAKEIGDEIAAAPVRTMSDLADKAIVLGWLLNPTGGFDHWYVDDGGDLNDLIGPIVAALAGIDVMLCTEEVDQEADAVAA